VILQQTAGIAMDRENIGGNMSGRQSNYVSRGGSPMNNKFLDIFNAFNNNTVQAVRVTQNAANANQIQAITAPRVLRFGLRVSW
jgi:hypothetical protein